MLVGAGRPSPVQVSVRVLWFAARVCAHGRQRERLSASDRRRLDYDPVLHESQAAGELRKHLDLRLRLFEVFLLGSNLLGIDHDYIHIS